MALTDGSATHDAIAHGLATKDWAAAIEVADARFDADLQQSVLLPEELPSMENHRKTVHAMVEAFRGGFEGEDYQIIQPECQFDVELPGTRHNCIFVHWIDKRDAVPTIQLGPPPPEAILAKVVQRCSCRDCEVSHRLVGKTDAIVVWRHNIWLLEHKTTAILGAQFWDQFLLDLQPTTYCYGVWKSIKYRPSGVIVNALFKPSEKQVNAWTKGKGTVKDYVRYEREPFLRNIEDLERVEQQYIDICDEWEERIVSGKWPMSNIRTVCLSYNRRCDFHGACMAHELENSLDSLNSRLVDYVDNKLVEIQTRLKGDK